MQMKYRSRLHRFHQEARKALKGKQHVLGVGLGVKLVGGKPSNIKCVTVVVRSKTSAQKLGRRDRIPKHLKFEESYLPTDVIEVGKLRPQNGPLPFGNCVSSNNTYFGTRSAYFVEGSALHALTCAHVIWGPAAEPAMPPPPPPETV